MVTGRKGSPVRALNRLVLALSIILNPPLPDACGYGVQMTVNAKASHPEAVKRWGEGKHKVDALEYKTWELDDTLRQIRREEVAASSQVCHIGHLDMASAVSGLREL
jgi:hypothetical protein